jgi:hypothetical protein
MGKMKKKIIEASSLESIIKNIDNDLGHKNKDIVLTEKESCCRVCGFEYDDENAPWTKFDNQWFPNYEICVCCRVHFGIGDTSEISVTSHRENWIASGGDFDYKPLKPRDWSIETQLKNIPKRWRPE